MRKRRLAAVHLTEEALLDIVVIAEWSSVTFWEAAALRYIRLIEQAIDDLEENPERPGSQPRPELLAAGAHAYQLCFSRNRARGISVKEPRHLLLYRRREDGALEIARVIHEARGLRRHLPENYLR